MLYFLVTELILTNMLNKLHHKTHISPICLSIRQIGAVDFITAQRKCETRVAANSVKTSSIKHLNFVCPLYPTNDNVYK